MPAATSLNVVLARPTDTAVTLSVLATRDRDLTLAVVPGNHRRALHAVANVPLTVDIASLEADRGYQFDLTGDSATLHGQFHTARRTGAAFRFVVQADSHLDGNSDPRVYERALHNMIADAPDFLIDLGDTFMTDKYRDFHDASPQYAAQRGYLGITGPMMPLYLVQGNHDGEAGWAPTVAAWSRESRVRLFPPVERNAFYSTPDVPGNHYAWTWGDATFIVLDPFAHTVTKPNRAGDNWVWTLGREQYDWLHTVLERSRAKYTFVFIHHLVGGKGSEARGGTEQVGFWEWGGANEDGSAGWARHRPGWDAPIHELFVRYHVSAVFHGHDHLYVHQTRDGIDYQETPQPSFAREGATQSAAEYGYSAGTVLGSSGHLRVSVSPAHAIVEYVRARVGANADANAGNGDVVDRYEILPARR